MKTNSNQLLLMVIVLAIAFSASAKESQGIQFFTGTWSEALAKAQQENKPIFVDFYATWCGPCRQMARDVFTHQQIGSYFNDTMINIQINAEAQEPELVASMNLEAYPTLAVFDPLGKVMSRQVGALDVQQLLDFAKASTSFEIVQKQYLAEPTNFDRINAYLSAQSFRDKDKLDSLSTSILNSLSEEQLRTREAWNILVNYSANYHSRAFAFVTNNAKWYMLHIPEKNEFQQGYSWFINAMMEKSVETEDMTLLRKATADFLTMRRSCGTLNKPEAYFREAFQIRYLALAEDSKYQQRLVKFVNTYHPNEWKKLASNALYLLSNNPSDAATKQAAIRMAYKALSLNNNPYTNWAAGIAKNAEGKTAEAKQLVLLALQKTGQGELLLDATGSVSINLEELGDTVVSIPLRVN